MENSGYLTLLHSERPKLYAFLAFLSAVVLNDEHRLAGRWLGSNILFPKHNHATVWIF